MTGTPNVEKMYLNWIYPLSLGWGKDGRQTVQLHNDNLHGYVVFRIARNN